MFLLTSCHNLGTCTVKNPETNQDYPIKVVKEGKSSGPNGENGKVGTSGKCGINGNDMVLIDRSAKETSKHYQGSKERKLTTNYVYKSEYLTRLNGYYKYKLKENACFAKFNHGETIDMSQSRAKMAQERTVRKTSSEAVAKQSIVIGKVMSEVESLFGKQNAFLADACEESAKASLKEEAEEEEDVDENVTEEVVVLRQKEDTNNLLKFTSGSQKKVEYKSKFCFVK